MRRTSTRRSRSPGGSRRCARGPSRSGRSSTSAGCRGTSDLRAVRADPQHDAYRISLMQTETQTVPASKAALWAGWTLTTLAVLFLLVDAGMKVAMAEVVLEASTKLEVPARVIPGLGVVLLVATVL